MKITNGRRSAPYLGLDDFGMQLQKILDFLRLYVFSAPDDDVFYSTGDHAVTVFAQYQNVPKPPREQSG